MSKRGPRFSEKEKLAILKEGKKNGVKAVCAKYGVRARNGKYSVNGILSASCTDPWYTRNTQKQRGHRICEFSAFRGPSPKSLARR